MKNKDFIKKSIEENIVDHTTILNNLKAKVAVIEGEKAAVKPHAHIGLKRAVIIFALFALTIAGVCGASYLFKSNVVIAPPDISILSSVSTEISEEEIINIVSKSVTSKVEESVTNCQSVTSSEAITENSTLTDVSREPVGIGENSNDTRALDMEETEFFIGFSEKFMVFQNLIYANLDYNEKLLNDGYAPVEDDQFKKLEDIRVYLESFLTLDSAGEVYTSLVSCDKCIYYESDNVLFMLTEYKDIIVKNILLDTAEHASETEDNLKINVKLDIMPYENVYTWPFRFKKNDNDKWQYDYDSEEFSYFE